MLLVAAAPASDPAVTAEPGTGALVVVGAVILVVLVARYLWSCYRFPNWPCRFCGGKGRFTQGWPWRKAWRKCPACKGTATKFRWGTRTFFRSRTLP